MEKVNIMLNREDIADVMSIMSLFRVWAQSKGNDPVISELSRKAKEIHDEVLVQVTER